MKHSHGIVIAAVLPLLFTASFTRQDPVPLVDHHQHLISQGTVDMLNARRREADWIKPVTAETVISLLDAAGIRRAVVLSGAFTFGGRNFDRQYRETPEEVQTARGRAENDWTAQQVQKFPDRLIAFCSFHPNYASALDELRRCARNPVFKGVKLHLDESNVLLTNAAQAEQVRLIFAEANRLRLPIAIHYRNRDADPAATTRALLKQVLPAAPDVPVQIAHLAGGGAYSEAALALFADAFEAHDPVTRNLWFDVTDVALTAREAAQPDSVMNRMVALMRKIGIDRMLYGSDPAIFGRATPRESWALFRRLMPLTDQEIARIAGNVAPYISSPRRAEADLPKIRSTVPILRIRDGDVMKTGWRLDASLRPDVYRAELVNGKPHRVTFFTDIDSISFIVNEGERYDFIVQKGDTAYPTQIAGVRLVPAAGVVPGRITVSANPDRVCADERRIPYLNFDLVVRNGTERQVEIRELRALVYDAAGTLIERRVVAQQALDVLGTRRVAPLSAGLIFNPFNFHSASGETRIRYEMDISPDDAHADSLIVTPVSCLPRARMILPMAGRIAVFDGHDVLSHHRRSGYLGRGAQALGIIDNAGRFGLDLMVIDAQGRAYRGDGKRNEDWLSWGHPVRAAADGIVVNTFNDQPDNSLIGSENLWTERSLAQNEMSPSGNYVLIDHGNGEFSLNAHLRRGSVKVKPGDRVKAGDIVAQVGNSGSSLGPHLHYELRTGYGVRGIRGLPAYFHDVTLLGSEASRTPTPLLVNTGDVLIAR